MRFRSVNLQRTIFEVVRDALTQRGWVNDPVNFGTVPATFFEDSSMEAVTSGTRLAPNSVHVSLTDEGRDDLAQLGGGLYDVRYSLFVDCYGETGNMAWRILEDLKPVLHDAVIRVVDYAPETPVQTDEVAEVDVIAIEAPGRAVSGERAMEARRNWRVLTAWVDVTHGG